MAARGYLQVDILARPWYLVNTSFMIQSLRTSTPGVKQAWLANDLAGGGQIVQLYESGRKEVWLSCEWIKELADCQVGRTCR